MTAAILALGATAVRHWQKVARAYNESMLSTQAEAWLKKITAECGCTEWENDDDAQ
jgi:hypothetical protein